MSKNTVRHNATVTRHRRELQNKHKSFVLWFTGYSGSGKSSLAHTVEEQLHQMGCRTYVLDGDNVRHGLCSDLGFSPEDRAEKILRIGEMAGLLEDAGIITLAAFISPSLNDRQKIRALFEDGEFIDIHCRCSIEACEKRDTKGLYKRAREGKVGEFTGITAPYEEPANPDLVLDTEHESLMESAQRVLGLLKTRNLLIEP